MLAAFLATALACDAERRPSEGWSAQRPPLVWQMTSGPRGATEEALSPETISLTVMATSPLTSQLLSLGARDDDGRMLIDALEPDRSFNRVLPGHGLVVGVIPSASTAVPLSRHYSVEARRLDSQDGAGLTVTVWVKRALDGLVPAVQALPLSVLLVGGAGSPVRTTSGRLDVALGQVGRIWRAAGIEILEPAKVHVDGPDQIAIDPALGSDSPMVGQVLRLSERTPGTLALVVVNDLVIAGTGFGLWALSGAIPVPPVSGTPRSGVVVSATLIERDPIWAGQIIAHEIGHALGLFHTTERALVAGQALHDQLDHSPRCPADADHSPQDQLLTAKECEAHDAANLMFWETVRGATRLTSEQAEMARRSALVR